MKTLFLHITFICFALKAFAQKPVVFLEIQPQEAEIGEMLTITVKANVQGEIEIDFPSSFVHGYNIMNGMEQEIDYTTGKVVTYYYLTQVGAMPKAGVYKFGPAYIKKGNKVYRSNTVSVTIKKENTPVCSGTDLTAKQLNQPAFGIIEKSKSVIYEGEPVILNAKVYAQNSPTHLENYQSYSLDGVLDKHEIGSSTRIVVEEEKIKRSTYYVFEYDKQIIFPIGTGKMTIDPFKLTLRRGFENLTLTSSSTTIEVKPLPNGVPADFIGGIGQFTIASTIQKGKFKQGDVFTMVVEIAGTGNLQNISEPKIKLPQGFLIYGDPIIKEDFVYGNKGAEGKISYEYNIQITKFGKLKFPETTISYFDPTKEKYVSIATEGTLFEIERNIQFKEPIANSKNSENLASEESLALRMDEGDKDFGASIVKTYGFWAGLSSPLILALMAGVWWNKKEKNGVVKSQKNALNTLKNEVKNVFQEADQALHAADFIAYYNLIEKGVHQSLTLYLTNSTDQLISKSTIFQLLAEKHCESSKIDALKSLFSKCEQARYGMGIDADERANLILSAKQVVKSITEA